MPAATKGLSIAGKAERRYLWIGEKIFCRLKIMFKFHAQAAISVDNEF
jgi:hypothetical protein